MTSVRRTGAAHLRGGSMPARTRRDSALRRMRVARWSRRKRLARVSGSASLVSSSVMKSSWRPRRFWLRRPRLTKLSAMLRRRTACSTARSRAVSWTVLRASATSATSSRVLTRYGGDGGHGDVVAEGCFEDVEHGVGEAVFGHFLGLVGQGPQRLGDRPRHQPRQHGGQQQREDAEGRVPPLAGHGRRVQGVGPVEQLGGDRLLQLAEGLAVRPVGHRGLHGADVDRAGGDRLVEVGVHVRVQVGREVLGHDVGVVAGGVLELLAEALELGLLGRHPGDAVEPDATVDDLVAEDLGHGVAHDLDLTGDGVGQLGALAQLRVVDRHRHVGDRVEERGDQRGVAVVGRPGERRARLVRGTRVVVDVGADLLQLVEPVERARERALDLAALALDLVAEHGDRLVGVRPGSPRSRRPARWRGRPSPPPRPTSRCARSAGS